MRFLFAFLKAIPDLLQLVKTIQKRIDEAKADRKVSDDVKVIHEVFVAQDSAKLNALFASE